MDAPEITDEDEKLVSKKWVKHLRDAVEKINTKVNARLGLSPIEAIKLDKIKLKKPIRYLKEKKILPSDGLFRYMLQPGEKHGDQKQRATDNIWSRKTYRLSDIEEIPGQCVLYHLQDGPDRTFVQEELMLISEDTELPPADVKSW